MKIEQFTFGDPTPVLDNADILNYFESVLMYEKYYNPPVDFSGLARAVKSSAHHQMCVSSEEKYSDEHLSNIAVVATL